MNLPGAASRPDPARTDAAKSRYGLIAVLGGFVALIAVFAIAVIRYPTATDVGIVLGSVVTAIGTLAGAYFGVQAGQAGKDRADDRAAEAMSELRRRAGE